MTKHRPHSHERLTFDEALLRLESSDYKVTKPRRFVLEAIMQQRKPFSVATLAKILKGKKGCDQVTIYRSLPVFIELGLIEKCDFTDEMAHYEVAHGLDSHHHHHIVCTSCHKVEPLAQCLVEAQEKALQGLGYRNLRHRLEFSGTCPACA